MFVVILTHSSFSSRFIFYFYTHYFYYILSQAFMNHFLKLQYIVLILGAKVCRLIITCFLDHLLIYNTRSNHACVWVSLVLCHWSMPKISGCTWSLIQTKLWVSVVFLPFFFHVIETCTRIFSGWTIQALKYRIFNETCQNWMQRTDMQFNPNTFRTTIVWFEVTTG